MTDKNKICLILVPGFAPDNIPVLGLAESLRNHGYAVIASNFFGDIEVTDFSNLTADECAKNISKIINEASEKYEKVFGIGVCLGGALLLEHAKNNKNLDGIVSIGTPFKLRNRFGIKMAQIVYPLIYPLWKQLQKNKKLRLLPIGAGNMAVKYLDNEFIENLKNIDTPALFLHSKKDKVTDYRALEKFVPQISSQKRQITYFDNGNHFDYNPELIMEYAFEFLDR